MHPLLKCLCMLNFLPSLHPIPLQLREVWVEHVTSSTEGKIRDDCVPGKPISVFSNKPHKVH